jgi:hypothetical protein
VALRRGRFRSTGEGRLLGRAVFPGLGNATIGGLRIPDPGEMRMTRKRPSLVLGFLALGARAVKHCRPAEQPGDGETTRRSALGCSTREINLAAASASCTFPLRRSTRLEPRLSWLSLFIFPSDIDRLRWRKVAEDEMFENASTAKVKAGGPCSLLHFALREDHLQNLCSVSPLALTRDQGTGALYKYGIRKSVDGHDFHDLHRTNFWIPQYHVKLLITCSILTC